MYYAVISYNDGKSKQIQSKEKQTLLEILCPYSFTMKIVKVITIHKTNGAKIGHIVNGEYRDI